MSMQYPIGNITWDSSSDPLQDLHNAMSTVLDSFPMVSATTSPIIYRTGDAPLPPEIDIDKVLFPPVVDADDWTMFPEGDEYPRDATDEEQEMLARRAAQRAYEEGREKQLQAIGIDPASGLIVSKDDYGRYFPTTPTTSAPIIYPSRSSSTSWTWNETINVTVP